MVSYLIRCNPSGARRTLSQVKMKNKNILQKDTDRGIVLLDPTERTQSVTVDEDDEDDDEETTSAVTEVDNAGRSTEYIPGDLPTDEGPSTSMHNLSSLPAKELYKVHLQKQIRKSDMEMDLIQLQMEEKRLSIKKATLEIELLEHRLKGFLWAIFFNTRRVALSSYSGNVVKYNTSHYDVACPLWTDPEPTQTLKPRLEDPYGHLHLGPCSAVSQVKACLWSRIRFRVGCH
ncbi:hypothetical protein H4Q32_023458 [Labeo rohita]|uniref:Uncharacterized protein n=1 Tax=Labeo rohita TaxID=84645 RepID=A0ABQ8M8K7_LABRO|nr:hypothetical protein H4Q32_023458 [Labeo rohita]